MAKYIIDIPEKEMVYLNIWKCEDGKCVWIDTHNTLDLKPYTASESYIDGLKKGQNDAWEFARKLTHPRNGGLYENEKKEIFDRRNSDSVLIGMSYQEAKAKYEAWKREKDKICVGDEVETESGNKACVLYENPDGTQMFVFKADGTATWWSKCAIHKTGKNHPEVAELLKKMREE